MVWRCLAGRKIIVTSKNVTDRLLLVCVTFNRNSARLLKPRRTRPMTAIRYQTATVDSLGIFYREAGTPGAPKLLLLHGFPSAGHMFRDLIPLLADRFHLVAPDLPGFGQRSEEPSLGKECFSTCNSRLPHDHEKKKQTQ